MTEVMVLFLNFSHLLALGLHSCSSLPVTYMNARTTLVLALQVQASASGFVEDLNIRI
jgi:hypothetical protein